MSDAHQPRHHGRDEDRDEDRDELPNDGRNDERRPDPFGFGLLPEAAPLTDRQRAAILAAMTAGAPPQKACADAGVDPLAFFAALECDGELAVSLGRVDALRSMNVLAVTYQKALSGASADRSLYLKFRPPPPAAGPHEGLEEFSGPLFEALAQERARDECRAAERGEDR